jgi:demethylmenaquinone methyltransferase/2-methoxy-6-polyprenyl-1,4-benzoquinol methylase
LTDSGQEILNEQAAYYRARAPEYDEWWQRSGRYDRGPDATARWKAEVEQVDTELAAAALTGHVADLACGTGWWTERLARTADRLTCIDASPETIEINRTRLRGAGLPLPHYQIR